MAQNQTSTVSRPVTADMSADESPVIELSDVSFSYGKATAVEDVSLTVDQGDFLGLIGPNGSGKTTLLLLMLGVKQPDAGSIQLFGKSPSKFDEGHRIGYVSQRSTDRGEVMPITVRETVLMGRFSHVGHRRIRKVDRKKAADALSRVGIEDLADRRINELSGGQRQRTFIARALASEADLLALDEPTVGVDVNSQAEFYDLLGELNDEGITIILVEHDIEALTEHVNKIACLNKTLYYHGDTRKFLESDALSEAYGPSVGFLQHDHP